MRFSHFTAITLIGTTHLIIPLVLILWTLGRSYTSAIAIPHPRKGSAVVRQAPNLRMDWLRCRDSCFGRSRLFDGGCRPVSLL